MRIALIDGDILRYEIGAICEGEDGPMSWQYVEDTIETKIANICAAAGASLEPYIFLTEGKTFRDEVAVTKPYKGNRKEDKPFHFKNITTYLNNQFQVIQKDGLEADDMMAIYQTQYNEADTPDETVICTRDKDLLQVPGWHYGWECGKQRERFVHKVDENGFIIQREKKFYGEGMAFFFFQLLMGDSTDNIPGAKGVGQMKAYAHLAPLEVPFMWQKVREVYDEKGHDDEYLLEQGQLLWMVRGLKDGEPLIWQLPD